MAFNRREFIAMCLGGAALAPKLSAEISPDETAFLEDLCKRSFLYFWEQSSSQTGLVMDRAKNDGTASGDNVASIAATGFGLTALCIGASHRWVSRAKARERVAKTLRFLLEKAPEEHGFFLHFMDGTTGERRIRSEVSSVDTALFLAGALTAAEYFHPDPEITSLADQLFERVDFQWMLNGDPFLLSHGVKPETGFLKSRWNKYCEASILYLLAIGAPKYPIPGESWYAWRRPVLQFGNWTFVTGGPLFTHQFSHAWIDFRNIVDAQPLEMNYFRNSVFATYAHREFCISLQRRFPAFGPNMWGITASDSPEGYLAWGGPPRETRIDGTLVPCAPGGSLMFAPEICIPVLRQMVLLYGDKLYGRYGFADAFNPGFEGPDTVWVNPDVIGIDVGITLLSAENLLTGNIWKWFMNSRHIRTGLERAQFRQVNQQPVPAAPPKKRRPASRRRKKPAAAI